MRKEKRGQVTVFIIIGILIVIVFGVIFFASEGKFSKRTLTEAQVEPVRTYLVECVEGIVKEDLALMRRNGGYLDSRFLNTKNCNSVPSVIIATRSVNNAVRNLVPELRDDIEDRISSECGLNDFRDQFSVTEGDKRVDVYFDNKEVNVEIDTNIVVGKGIGSISLGRILISVDDDIFAVNELAREMAKKFTFPRREVFDSIKYDINEGSIDIINTHLDSRLNLNSHEILGTGCGDKNPCSVVCPGGCCQIFNKFREENRLGLFRFVLEE